MSDNNQRNERNVRVWRRKLAMYQHFIDDKICAMPYIRPRFATDYRTAEERIRYSQMMARARVR